MDRETTGEPTPGRLRQGPPREQGPRARSTRWTWLLLNYALAADVLYRAAVLRQDFGLYADIVFIWMGSLVFYVVTQLSASGFAVVAADVSFVPTLVLAAAVALAAFSFVSVWNAWLVVGGVFLLVLFTILAMLLIRRRNPLP